MEPTNISFPRYVKFEYEGRTYNVHEDGRVEIYTSTDEYVPFDYADFYEIEIVVNVGSTLLESSFKNEFLALCEKYPEVDVNIDDYGNKIRIIGAWDDSTECEEE